MNRDNYFHQRGGIVAMILIIAAILLSLSYFGISIRQVINSPTGQENFGLAKELLIKIWGDIVYVWNNWLREPAALLWDRVLARRH